MVKKGKKNFLPCMTDNVDGFLYMELDNNYETYYLIDNN